MPEQTLELPTLLVESVGQYGPPARKDWLRALPSTVGDVAEDWGLTLGRPYQPGGECSWTAPVTTAGGDELAVKVWWAGISESEHEGAGLRAWDGHGAVEVHRDAVVGDSRVLLLERCSPGTTLAAEPALRQDETIGAILRRLWEAPTDGPFRPLTLMCDEWVAEFEEKVADGGIPGGADSPLDPGQVRLGLELFGALPREATRSALLPTDLHAGNVLAAQREPWLLIDPNPYVGDPTYDPLQHMLNDRDRLLTDPSTFARRMAGLTGVDPDRLVCWLFARCVQESIDQPELAGVVRLLGDVVAP